MSATDLISLPEYSTSTERAQPPTLPPPIQQLLAGNDVWAEVCLKMGRSPNEWMSYRQPIYDTAGRREQDAVLEAVRVKQRAEYDAALLWMLSVIRYNPGPILEALGIKCECGGCCCDL